MIIFLAIAIVFTIGAITFLAYFSVSKILRIKRQKFNLDNSRNNLSIFNKLLNELGTIKNIENVKENKIYVTLTNLVNANNFKKMGIKTIIENNFVILESKEYSIELFLKKLKQELKNKS